MRNAGIIACALTLCVSAAHAAPGGGITMTFWNNLQPEDQGPFLSGAIEMLSGFGLQCPGRVSLKDVKDDLNARLQTGKSATDDRFVWEVLAVFYGRDCVLDKRIVELLDPAARKKLRAVPR